MTKYAVIQVVGKQYRVSEGDVLTVARLETPTGEKQTVETVLAVHDGKELTIGTPLVDKAKVVFEVVEESRSPNMRVATYKAKSRYRRVKGSRQHLSTIKVLSIS